VGDSVLKIMDLMSLNHDFPKEILNKGLGHLNYFSTLYVQRGFPFLQTQAKAEGPTASPLK
jgi:hypothetical protein